MPDQDNKPHSCTQESRIQALERRDDDHSDRIRRCETSLADGRVQFAELRKDMQATTSAVDHLAKVVELSAANNRPDYAADAIRAVIFWVVPAAIGVVIWLVKAGAVKA